MSIESLYMKEMCKDCPFKKDYLPKERMDEIISVDSFVCHKTLDSSKTRKQCAGHMKFSKNNKFVSIAKNLNIKLKLS